MAIGPDHYLYAVIGNVNAGDSILQNDKGGKGPHDTSVIFRIDPNMDLQLLAILFQVWIIMLLPTKYCGSITHMVLETALD